MSMSSLICVIVPAYNAENTIGLCISSIQRQTYPNIEILVVDDGSDDGTAEVVLSSAMSDSRIRLLRVQHHGVARARNMGIEHSHGEWVAFADADDELPANALQSLLANAEEFGADMVAGGMSFESALGKEQTDNKTFGRSKIISDLSEDFGRLYETNYVQSCCSKLFKRRCLLDRGLRLDESLSSYEDFEFVLRCLMAGMTMSVTDAICYRYLRHSSGSGSTTFKGDMSRQMALVANRYIQLCSECHVNEAGPTIWKRVVQFLVIAVNNAAAAPSRREAVELVNDIFHTAPFSEAAVKATEFPNRYSRLIVHLGARKLYCLSVLLASNRNRIRRHRLA